MYRFVITLLLLFCLPAQAQPIEQLHYRLSYSGLITGYVWKDLADMTLQLTPEVVTFRDQPAVRLQMEVSTRHYSIAEAVHALRYRWESILDPSLQRTLLVRVIDQGDSDSHDVYWYQWLEKDIAIFHKREQVDVSIPLFDEEPRLEWETSRFPPPPIFIDHEKPVADGLSYMLMKKHKLGKLERDAIDPLSMLMRIRDHDYRTQTMLPMDIINEDDLAPYRAYLLGEESLAYQGRMVPTLKIEVLRNNQEGEEGAMQMWLSDDEQRRPLRIDIDAPLGMLHIELQQEQPPVIFDPGKDHNK
jgi:hypothetical protein